MKKYFLGSLIVGSSFFLGNQALAATCYDGSTSEQVDCGFVLKLMCQDDAECLRNAHASDNKYYLNPDGTVDIKIPQQEETESIDVKTPKPSIPPGNPPSSNPGPVPDPVEPSNDSPIVEELPPLIPIAQPEAESDNSESGEPVCGNGILEEGEGCELPPHNACPGNTICSINTCQCTQQEQENIPESPQGPDYKTCDNYESIIISHSFSCSEKIENDPLDEYFNGIFEYITPVTLSYKNLPTLEGQLQAVDLHGKRYDVPLNTKRRAGTSVNFRYIANDGCILQVLGGFEVPVNDCEEDIDIETPEGGFWERICNDNIDNDKDGKTDCASQSCNGHKGTIDGPRYKPGYCEYGRELNCEDGFDNDADGLTDEEDPNCEEISHGSENDNNEEETPEEELCEDGIDNNNDGQTDCYDPSCYESPSCIANTCDNVEEKKECLGSPSGKWNDDSCSCLYPEDEKNDTDINNDNQNDQEEEHSSPENNCIAENDCDGDGFIAGAGDNCDTDPNKHVCGCEQTEVYSGSIVIACTEPGNIHDNGSELERLLAAEAAKFSTESFDSGNYQYIVASILLLLFFFGSIAWYRKD